MKCWQEVEGHYWKEVCVDENGQRREQIIYPHGRKVIYVDEFNEPDEWPLVYCDDECREDYDDDDDYDDSWWW